MGKDLPFMKLWVGDLLQDVLEMGLTDEEFGVYMKLLCVAWQRGSIFERVEMNARWCSCSEPKIKKLWPAFAHKWVPDGEGGLVNPKQEEVREEALTKSNKASESAKTRWEKVRRERAEREAAESEAEAA
jgi:uncharacterized protein YdaU (DUF1376 family)